MGNEHGGTLESRLGFQRDRDNDFRSCTTSRPIGSDSAQNSPRLLVKNKLTPKNLPSSKIVVVTEGTAEDSYDQNLKSLSNTPICYPVIPISGYPSHSCQTDAKLFKLDPAHLSEICLRYQEHLGLCSQTITSDQNALSSKIKEIETLILNQYASLIERRNRFAKYSEQIQKVNDMQSTLGRIHNTLENTIAALDEINGHLPEGERLENLILKKPILVQSNERIDIS